MDVFDYFHTLFSLNDIQKKQGYLIILLFIMKNYIDKYDPFLLSLYIIKLVLTKDENQSIINIID